MSIWAYPHDDDSQRPFFEFQNGSGTDRGLWYIEGDNHRFYDGTIRFLGNPLNNEGEPTENEWQHFAITFNSGTLKGYYNGQLANTHTGISSTMGWSGTTQLTKIGADIGAANLFDGRLAGFGYFSSVLTDTQIGELYNLKPYGNLNDHTANTTLRYFFSFGDRTHANSSNWHQNTSFDTTSTMYNRSAAGSPSYTIGGDASGVSNW